MEISRDNIERLAFVKFLLSQARIQKDFERPRSSSAILTIHDCVECFLQLCYEAKTGKAKMSSKNILDTYAEEINLVLKTEDKAQINKAYIKRINDLRNQLKHATIFTDHRQIPNLYTETEIFLTDFTKTIFEKSFESISIIELITDEIIKHHLLESQLYFEQGKLQKSMWYIGKAFSELENNLTKVKGEFGRNLLARYHKIDYLTRYQVRIGGEELSSNLKSSLKEIAVDMNSLLDEIEKIKTVLSLSVNLKDYTYFKQQMPYVAKIINGTTGETEFWIPDESNNKIVKYEKENVKYCLNFVIELALKKE